MNGELQINKSQILMFESEDGSFHLEVRLEDETVWLTQGMIVELFQSSKANISEHIANIFSEGELSPESTVRKSEQFRRRAYGWLNENEISTIWTSSFP